MAIVWMSLSRWLPQKSFPPYAYLPGRNPHPVRDPTGHSYHVGALPVATEASLGSDAFLWGLDLFNHGYYWEAHEAWEGLWHVSDRDNPLRVLFKSLILLSAAGVNVRERKNAAAARQAVRAAALLRELLKVQDSTIERALGMCPPHSLNTPKRPQEFPLNCERRRLDSLNLCSISFSDHFSREAVRTA